MSAKPDWEQTARRLDGESAAKRSAKRQEPRERPRPTRTKTRESTARSKAAGRVLELLQNEGVLRAKEIGERLQMPRTTVAYYLAALLATEQVDPAPIFFRGRTTTGYTIAEIPPSHFL